MTRREVKSQRVAKWALARVDHQPLFASLANFDSPISDEIAVAARTEILGCSFRRASGADCSWSMRQKASSGGRRVRALRSVVNLIVQTEIVVKNVVTDLQSVRLADSAQRAFAARPY